MSLLVYAESSNGTFAEWADRLRWPGFEVTEMAEEMASGSSSVVLEDPTASFYIQGHRIMYFKETEAEGDPFFGIIGPFLTGVRKFGRGNERIGSRRRVTVELRDINAFASLRVQKGTDAERPAERDTRRVQWVVQTAEFIGGYGDNGFSVEDTSRLFTDSPVDMSQSDYTGQYGDGVLNDAMQQSGANAYLYNSPTDDIDPIRIGIWYGRTERSDFASLHKISNVLADISADVLDHFDGVTPQYSTGYVFPPSYDTELERDPSRLITGAMVQFDGDYVYESQGALLEDSMVRRDMVFAAELVKTETAATARAFRLLNDLDTEDDAIPCSVIVPGWLINAFRAGHRVQFKNSYMPGYETDYVWMRVAKRTVRQLAASPSPLYELALDLRAETPPLEPGASPGGSDCEDAFASQSFYPLGNGTGGNAADTPAPGAIQYHRAGITEITEPSTTHINSWQFPVFGSGGSGTQDYAGANIGNSLRIVVSGSGTLTIDGFFSFDTSGSWKVCHYIGSTEVVDDSGSIALNGTPPSFDIEAHDDFCYHTVIIHTWSSSGPGRFTFEGATWVAA